MRKFIVIVLLLYAAAVVAGLGFISNWFHDSISLQSSAIALPLAIGGAAVLAAALLALRQDDGLFTALFVLVVAASGYYVANAHYKAYNAWLPSLAAEPETESSGTAVLNAHGRTLRYRLVLSSPGTVTHREYLIVTENGKDKKIPLPVFNDTSSGYVSAKSPKDWITLRPTTDADVYDVELGRFLFSKKSFRVNLQTAEAVALTQ